jgi:hypothetical protein
MTTDDRGPCEVCGNNDPRCTFGNPRGLCTCWHGTPCQPAPDPARCPGSLQTVLDAAGPATPCPVCRAPIAAVPLDGLPVLAEHRRAAAEALPMALEW